VRGRVPDRLTYLLEQKEKGRAVFGVFPALCPKEMLWAMGVVPAEIWDPPLELVKVNSHLQPYICSVVRSGMELVLQGKSDFLDGFLFPHTCDSIQNMASVIKDCMGPEKPCYFFYLPKAPYTEAARTYYLTKLQELAGSLEKQLGGFDQERLGECVRLSNRISSLIEKLYAMRAKGRLRGTSRSFYQLLRKGEHLMPEDLIPLLEQYLTQNTLSEPKGSSGVIFSGILPNPLELLDVLDQLGTRVVHDDLLNCGRRLLAPKMDTTIGPLEALAERYFHLPPCPTKGSGVQERLDFLLDLVKKTDAKGIIFNMVKFCEPEWFDLPFIQKGLKDHGVPTLVLDMEINQDLSAQMITRVEAFLELIS